MPSQPLSTFSTSLPSPVCLPLNKFSYATVSSEHIAPIPWIHLSSKNGLFAIFETSPTQLENAQLEDRPKLKVLKDPEVMVFLYQDSLLLGHAYLLLRKISIFIFCP